MPLPKDRFEELWDSYPMTTVNHLPDEILKFFNDNSGRVVSKIKAPDTETGFEVIDDRGLGYVIERIDQAECSGNAIYFPLEIDFYPSRPR
jgi:hypothetical protein